MIMSIMDENINKAFQYLGKMLGEKAQEKTVGLRKRNIGGIKREKKRKN